MSSEVLVGRKVAMVGDHPVLEFLGTVRMVEGVLTDRLQSDADVVTLLRTLGWSIQPRGMGLLEDARKLREDVRVLVGRRKARKELDLSVLNQFLMAGPSYIQLEKGRKGALALQRVREQGTTRGALAPLAEAAAELLATGDFELIRRCEGKECVLWFYDRTKSHRRRWCSMADCGNRHKVAAFRQRAARGEIVTRQG